jgi:hypothetical protein
LADGDQDLVGAHEVRRALDYLRGWGLREDAPPKVRNAVVIVDIDDRELLASTSSRRRVISGTRSGRVP